MKKQEAAGMKLIIAGGRDYQLTLRDIERLDELSFSEVVSGGCAGVDREGERYAEHCGVLVVIFPADWKTHGKAAGPIRNRQMAEYADAVALFPGGIGTQSMYSEAMKAGIDIFDFRIKRTVDHCWSCDHYENRRCAIGHAKWPIIGKACGSYSYEPGSDAAEAESRTCVPCRHNEPGRCNLSHNGWPEVGPFCERYCS